MKKILSFICAAALALSAGAIQVGAEAPAFSAMPSYSSTATTVSGYTTAAGGNYNSVSFRGEGSLLQVSRRSYKRHSRPDHVIVTQKGNTVLEQEFEWSSPVYSGNGYDSSMSLAALPDGQYTLTVKSSDGYIYTVDETILLKSGGVCSFPRNDSLSKRYNYDALQRLESGQAPGDFAVLQAQYGTAGDRQILGDIQAKAVELTRGCSTDREKVLAIDWWIAQNIAYDMGVSGDLYYPWIAEHPDDTSRLDNPLRAFSQKYALCYGYAKLTVLMMGYAGVDCVYLTGRLAIGDDVNSELGAALTQDVMNHAWNAVKIDGGWYYLDTNRNALRQYHRTDPQRPETGYTEAKLAPAYMFTLPSLDFLSKTHLAMRMGVKNAGTKLSAAAIPQGWQGGGFYTESGQLRNTWARIDGAVYRFDGSGSLLKSWQLVDGYWRYFETTGALVTGPHTIREGGGERNYQFDSEGCVTSAGSEWLTFAGATRFYTGREMAVGWQYVQGYWRYFDAAGTPYGDEKKPLVLDGREYHFTGEGYLRAGDSGWVEFDGQRHYLDGAEARYGLQRIDGKDYLLDGSGTVLTGWQRSDGRTYLLGADGAMKTGWQFSDDNWYYLDREEGRFTGVHALGGKQLYFDAQGRLSTGGWVDIGGSRLYYDGGTKKDNVLRGGKLLRGWKRVDDQLRFFDPVDGRLYTGRDALQNPNNGKWYTFNSDGVASGQ